MIDKEVLKSVLERIEHVNDNPSTDDSFHEIDNLIQEIKGEYGIE